MTSPRRRTQMLVRRPMSSWDEGASVVAVRSGAGSSVVLGNGNSGRIVAAAIAQGETEVWSDPCGVLSTRSCVSQLDSNR